MGGSFALLFDATIENGVCISSKADFHFPGIL